MREKERGSKEREAIGIGREREREERMTKCSNILLVHDLIDRPWKVGQALSKIIRQFLHTAFL